MIVISAFKLVLGHDLPGLRPASRGQEGLFNQGEIGQVTLQSQYAGDIDYAECR